MKIRNYAEITKISLLNIKLELLIEEKCKLKEAAMKNGTLNSVDEFLEKIKQAEEI